MAPTNTGSRSSKKPAKAATATAKTSAGFTAEEKAAIREYAREKKAQAANADGESQLLEAIAKMEEPASGIATRLHALIKKAAPELTSKTWYGMPAYAKDGNTVCFFQNAGKFKARYQVLGFTDKAKLDEGAMWPNSYALLELGPAEQAKITELVKRAVS